MTLDTEARAAAAKRWRAIVAVNGCPGLSPAARRVFIGLVTIMDAVTMACFPGEVRLAGLIDMSPRSIKAAKKELKEFGLIYWTTPGGPRHLCRYEINWSATDRLADLCQRRGETAREERVYKPTVVKSFWAERRPRSGSNGAASRINQAEVTSEAGCTIESPQGANGGRHGAAGCTPKVQRASPELTHGTCSANITQQFVGACALESAAPPKVALEKQSTTSPRIRDYPRLWEAFKGDVEALDRLEDIHPDQIGKASVALALQGRNKARCIIMGSNP